MNRSCHIIRCFQIFIQGCPQSLLISGLDAKLFHDRRTIVLSLAIDSCAQNFFQGFLFSPDPRQLTLQGLKGIPGILFLLLKQLPVIFSFPCLGRHLADGDFRVGQRFFRMRQSIGEQIIAFQPDQAFLNGGSLFGQCIKSLVRLDAKLFHDRRTIALSLAIDSCAQNFFQGFLFSPDPRQLTLQGLKGIPGILFLLLKQLPVIFSFPCLGRHLADGDFRVGQRFFRMRQSIGEQIIAFQPDQAFLNGGSLFGQCIKSLVRLCLILGQSILFRSLVGLLLG